MTIEYRDAYQPIQPDALARIPERMKSAKRWIVWGSNKVPASVTETNRDGYHFGIDYKDPHNWRTYDEAVSALGKVAYMNSEGYFHIVGIGFVVGDGWICADLDGGAGHKRENVPQYAIADALNFMQTYGETSVSGCGYHVFGYAEDFVAVPESWEPNQDTKGKESYEIEFFTRRKFIAITGNRYDDRYTDVTDCAAGARDFHQKYLADPYAAAEEKRKSERREVEKNISVNATDAERMFLLNFPEILSVVDSSDFKRDTKNGGYSWVGAVKSMRDIGVPYDAVLEWCRRGSNFKSDRDVEGLWNERRKAKGKSGSVALLVKLATEAGWKPDPEKLTGEYAEKHQAAEERKKRYAERDRFQSSEEGRIQRETIKKQLAEIGVAYSDTLTWTVDFNGNITEVTDKATGEIVYPRSEEPKQTKEIKVASVQFDTIVEPDGSSTDVYRIEAKDGTVIHVPADDDTGAKAKQIEAGNTIIVYRNEDGTIADLQTVQTKDASSTSGDTKPEKQPKTFKIVTSDEINNGHYEKPQYIIENLLYPGLTILAAPPKTGKSFLCLDLACKVAEGKQFWGMNTTAGDVIYLDLEGKEWRTKERLSSLGYDRLPSTLEHTYEAEKITTGLIEQMTNWIESKHSPRLIIIDTVAHVKSGSYRNENAYETDTRNFKPLHDIALAHNVAIIAVTHMKKIGHYALDDPFEAISGSTAQFGNADSAWLIVGGREEKEKKFLATGRDIEEVSLQIESSKSGWIRVGTTEEITKERSEEAYAKHPVILTLRSLIIENGGVWSGTMQNLIDEVGKHTEQYPFTDPKQLSNFIKLNVSLLARKDRIITTFPNPNGGRKGRKYTFRQTNFSD